MKATIELEIECDIDEVMGDNEHVWGSTSETPTAIYDT